MYAGNWVNDMMEGYGIYTWPDGRRYEGRERKPYVGEYRNSKKEGYGRMVAADRNAFEGYWKNGVQHGIGRYEASGETRFGIWNSGKCDRWLDPRNPADLQLIQRCEGTQPEIAPEAKVSGVGLDSLSKKSPVVNADTRPADSSSTKVREQDDEMLCKICYQSKNGIALIPCGHLFCKECVQKLVKCPLDMQAITKKVVIYY